MVLRCFCCLLILSVLNVSLVGAQDNEGVEKAKKEKVVDLSKIDAQFKNLKKLSKEGEVWFSAEDKVVVVGGKICLDRGQLEMFACVPQSKEHESIVVINGRAFEVHTALLAIGAKSGKPAVFAPKYIPASGDEIEVEVHWFDSKGKMKKVRVQEWIRDTKTKKAMTHDFIFAGSNFFHDTETGEKFYMAEGGEVICVSNFGTALLDIPVESSQLNDGLMFEAFPDRVPKLKTPVRLVLRKKAKKEAKEDGAKDAVKGEGKADKDEPKKE